MKKAKKYEFTIHLLESYIAWNEHIDEQQLKDIEEAMKLLRKKMKKSCNEIDVIIKHDQFNDINILNLTEFNKKLRKLIPRKGTRKARLIFSGQE